MRPRYAVIAARGPTQALRVSTEQALLQLGGTAVANPSRSGDESGGRVLRVVGNAGGKRRSRLLARHSRIDPRRVIAPQLATRTATIWLIRVVLGVFNRFPREARNTTCEQQRVRQRNRPAY